MTGAILAIFGVLGLVVAWFSRSKRRAEVERDQARGEAAVAEQTAAVVAADAERKVEARADERTVERAAAEATAAGDPHPERAAARERARRQPRAIPAKRKRGAK